MKNEEKSPGATCAATLEAVVFGPLERAIIQGTDPLTLLDIEDALRSIPK